MSKKLSAQTPLYLRSTQHFKLTRSRHTGRILPHSATSYPLLAMIMLCVGVLLIGWNSFVAADSGSYTVNVSVVGPPPTIAATISNPIEGDSFQINTIAINGTCPVGSYEKLLNNGVSSGIAICDQSGSYSIQVSLVNGINSLQVRDYNPGDSAGPISNTVDVTYYSPSINPAPGPISIPTPPPIITTVKDYLTLGGLDNNVPVHLNPTTSIPLGPIATTSVQPIFSGTASPFALITIIVHSNPIICHTTANSSGYWQCILPFALTPGLHTVNVSSIDPKTGTKLSIPQFNIEVEGNVTPSILNAVNPFRFTSSYTYRLYKINQQVPVQISLSGGTLPYTIYAVWGDGQRTTISRDKEGSFELAHIYKKSGGYRGSYTINLNATDSNKQQSSMQLIALVTAPSGTTSTTSGSGSSLLSGGINSGATHTFEKYVWSSYGLLSLMLFSFWLGGKQKFKRLKSPSKHHHRHHPA